MVPTGRLSNFIRKSNGLAVGAVYMRIVSNRHFRLHPNSLSLSVTSVVRSRRWLELMQNVWFNNTQQQLRSYFNFVLFTFPFCCRFSATHSWRWMPRYDDAWTNVCLGQKHLVWNDIAFDQCSNNLISIDYECMNEMEQQRSLVRFIVRHSLTLKLNFVCVSCSNWKVREE